MNKTRLLWSYLRTSLWFLPALMVAGSAVLAVVLIETDSSVIDRWLARWPRLFGAGAEGARGMLSTIAGSMMSVVGVTFSMTLVALALASSQYSSRVLRNFMGSRVTQGVLGIFAGIFTYCLIVLRTIRGGNEGDFVPNLAVFFGFVLALGGVGVLIFFIHHIASSIQASSIIAAVTQETIETIDRLFPEKLGRGPGEMDEEPTLRSIAERNWRVIPARETGYIQSVDNAGLLRVARDRKTIVRMERGIGEFVVQNTALVSLALEDAPDRETIADLQAMYSISRYRTMEQDAGFGIRQIVDVALKALSPGINDTTTAVMCVDYLSAILVRLAPRQIPSSHRYEGGELRVMTIGPTFVSLLAESFDQIRSSAKGNAAVMSRMLDALQILAGVTASAPRRRALHEQTRWIAELAERTLESVQERARIDTQLARVREAIEGVPFGSDKP